MDFKLIEEIIEKNQKIATIIIVFAILPWLGSVLISSYLAGEDLPIFLANATTELFSWKLVWIYLFCSFLMSTSLVVNTLIIVIGAYYLKFYSLIYLSPAYMLACTIGYFIGKNINKEAINNLISEVKGLKEITERMQDSQLSTVGLTKMSPVLPFVVTNALFGVLNFNFYKFFIGSFLGKWPRVLLFTFIGTSIKSLQEIYDKKYGDQWWVYAIGVGIFIISFAALYYTLIKKKDTNLAKPKI